MSHLMREIGPRRADGASWIDTGDTPILTPEEESALAVRAAEGDPEARDHLILANLRLVVAIAKHYRNRGVPFGDLVGEGNLGLIKAAESFDPARGFRFGTFAKHWIKQSIRLAIGDQTRMIRLPHNARKSRAAWKRTEAELSAALGRPPTHEETATAMGLSRTKLSTMDSALSFPNRVASLDGPADDEGSRHAEPADPRGDVASEAVDGEDDRRDLERRLGRLDERSRTMIGLRYGLDGADPLSAGKAAQVLNIDRSHVYKIERQALARLAV